MSSTQAWHNHTPESKIPRSDSRLASATCKGITASGRPCRRSIASAASRRGSTALSPGSPPTSPLHCWQHQPQPVLAAAATLSSPHANRVVRQSSLDTLVERVGSLNLDLDEKKAARPIKKRQPRPARPGFFAMLCCGPSSSDDDYYEVVRHKRKKEGATKPQVSVSVPLAAGRIIPDAPLYSLSRPASFIPRSLPNETAALLRMEMAKPTSVADEPGFIYMFWMTAEASPPVLKVVDSYLDIGGEPHRLSSPQSPGVFSGQKTMMVKIGRATNVHRRLSTWSKQCGYTLSLLRYYPHVPSVVPEGNAPTTPHSIRQVPFSHRVERLIHLELAGRRIQQGKCQSCGQKHREWFEVDASRSGIRFVDEVIQRWVLWAEMQRMSKPSR